MPAPSTLDALRARIESLERQAPDGGLRPSAHAQRRRVAEPAGVQGWGRAFSFGLDALDARLRPGGLPFGAHELCGPPGEPASAMLFAALMLARRFRDDPYAQALVVQEAGAVQEGGGLYGPGLWALGLDPGRLALVTAREDGEALRIVDEAVRSGAVAAVLAEAPRAARRLDLAATQRLNLYGRQTSTLAFLLVPDLEPTSAAMTRWRVRPAPSQIPNPPDRQPSRRHLGPPALELDLVRNRLGPPGRFTVSWSSDDDVFSLADPARLEAAPLECAPLESAEWPPLRPPVVPAPADRPVAPAGRPRRAAGGG